MIKKTFFILVTGYLFSIIQSCCSQEFEYQWKDIEIQIIDNSGEETVISENQKINKTALGFRVSLVDSVFWVAKNVSMINTVYITESTMLVQLI